MNLKVLIFSLLVALLLGCKPHSIVKNQPHSSGHTPIANGRPDYYITPTRDFTQYTKDCEEKYWNKETAFDWGQDVRSNLRQHLEQLAPEDFSKISLMVLPMIEESITYKIEQIQQKQLPLDEDALKGIEECVPFDRTSIQQALSIQSPLKELQIAISTMKDQVEILQSELLDLREQQRLGLFKIGNQVKHLETVAEKQNQTETLSRLASQIEQNKLEIKQLDKQYLLESTQLKTKIQAELHAIEHLILEDLQETRKLIQRTVQAKELPSDAQDLLRLKDLIWKRQIRGLKDIANHALVVEQSAIAPLTMGIIHYKRHREIQEAMTTFINDEAKHSATFRRFLVEKLEAKEFVSPILIKGANRYMWLARLIPSTGFFLAVIVEAIGAASLEFFGTAKYMPDALFCSICKTIAEQDEKRHMDLCVAIYNELYRKGNKWERLRNKMALKMILKSVYSDKTEDHQLIQAFRAFGVDSQFLYQHILSRLSQQLSRISLYVEPEILLAIIGRR